MIIGHRLREIREQKQLSQAELEKRTGLLRCNISRVENGDAVPAVKTLEKLARAFEIPMYQLVYQVEAPPELPFLENARNKTEWGNDRKESASVAEVAGVSRKNE
jgi:transcriptional regulator with XRE-family HTH domain